MWISMGFCSSEFWKSPHSRPQPVLTSEQFCSVVSVQHQHLPLADILPVGSQCGTDNSPSPCALGRWDSLPCFPDGEMQAKVNKSLV